ncbi:MAG TPA: PAS domain S-box protein, partial [Candidatus Omnitrophota bacterium]|nr:PAS domain S-box protein [Candidatus Omnitrophota bacterium]
MKTKMTLRNKPRVEESASELKRIIHNAVDGILVVDIASKDILYWNKSMSRMLGYNGKSLYGLNIKDIHPHKELPGIMGLFEKFCSNKIYSVRDIPIKNKKGGTSFADISGYTIDFCGRKCIVGFFRDAGERMKDKEALAKSERMYRTLAEAADDFVFVIDRNMRIEYVNTKGCKSFGLPIEKLVGKNLSTLFPKYEAAKKKKSVAKVFRERRPASFESIANLPSGQEWLNTILAPIFDKNGKVVSVLGVARDLSVRKKMEDNLRAEKAFSDAIIDSIPGAFYLLDKTGRFLKWNRYEEEIFGVSSFEFKKQYPNALDTIIENDKPLVKKKLKEVIDKGSAAVEAEVLTKAGPRHFFMTGKRLYREGEPYIVGVALDMTEHKKASDCIAAHKKRYDLVVAATGQLVYDYNMKDGSIEWSGNIKSVTGYDPHDMEDNIKTWSERIHPDDRERAMSLLDIAA